MKRTRPRPSSGARKAACTVSAAALMLGVSSAATVGFNIQANYCAATSYSGAIVTGPAFGIATGSWQSLSQMDTGYGCPAGYYTLNQIVDTSSSGGGLNPLPNGSLNLTWSGYTANVSGFGGYDRPGPHYTFGGNGYNPGNEQVYWGFIRDGVNFGPGSSGGNNNQPGYVIDIVGLKSLFTNSAYVVELVASADSMQKLTNAFVIDATHSSTQSVVYPSTPPVADSGDTSWIRGIGGGLSTGSGAVDADHLQIIGNRAAHAGDKVTGYNFASTISGFIITDQPVITMSPQSVMVAAGDILSLNPYTIGVPPLAFQWRKGGVPIPGATSSAYNVPNVTGTVVGDYDFVVTNLYGRATSGVASVTIDSISLTSGFNYVVDSKPVGAEFDGYNFGAVWQASNTDANGTNRAGVMNFDANTPSQIAVPGNDAFVTAVNGSISFWMRSAGPVGPGNGGATLFDYGSNSGNSLGLLVVQYGPSGNGNMLIWAGNTGSALELWATNVISDNLWHNIVITYGQAAGATVTVYVDGAFDSSLTNTHSWAFPAGNQILLGESAAAFWQNYTGSMDDVRVYNRILTPAEVATLHSTGSLVDTTALQLRLNFDAAPGAGVTLQWAYPGVTLQSADLLTGPWTDLTGAVSPYAAAGKAAKKFYRYRHNQATVLSNPFLM